jgi:hypothetical protein
VSNPPKPDGKTVHMEIGEEQQRHLDWLRSVGAVIEIRALCGPAAAEPAPAPDRAGET